MPERFAEQYPKNAEGHIQFPRDQAWRREMFPEDVFKHPAKANMFLVQELVDRFTKVGESILDPFAGTGTLLLGTLAGRHVLLIEIEPMFLELLNSCVNKISQLATRAGCERGNSIILPGDCRKVLPVPCDHAIFSPPYANITVRGNPFTGRQTYDARKQDADAEDKFKEGLDVYSGKKSDSLNMGLLNPFFFGQHMKRVYRKLADSIRKGGTVTVIVRDMKGSDGRVMLSAETIRGAEEAGFTLDQWHKYARPGSPRTDLEESRGHKVIKDEDVLVFRR